MFCQVKEWKAERERTNCLQELQEDQEDVLPSLVFVILPQCFVKGSNGKHKEERTNGLQELQED